MKTWNIGAWYRGSDFEVETQPATVQADTKVAAMKMAENKYQPHGNTFGHFFGHWAYEALDSVDRGEIASGVE